MAVTISHLAPVAHLPLVLGVLRKLRVAQLIDTLIPPNPAHGVLCSRGVEALVLAILDGHHALYKVGRRLAERGMLPLLQPGLEPQSLHDTRLGQILDALFQANLNQVFSQVSLRALETYAVKMPWIHQDTTTIVLYGAYDERGQDPRATRPTYGYRKDGRGDLAQVLLSLGVSGDSVDVLQAIEASLALGLAGVKGIVTDSKAYSQRTLGLCLEHQVGLVTLVPRTCAIRQEVEAWGQKQGSLPLLLDKPAKRRGEAPRRWYGRSLRREMDVEYSDGRIDEALMRFVAVYLTQLAQHHEHAYGQAQVREAEGLAEHIAQVQGRRFACAPDAEASIADYEGGGRVDGDALQIGGVIMRCNIRSRRSGSARNARSEIGRPRATRWKKNACIG